MRPRSLTYVLSLVLVCFAASARAQLDAPEPIPPNSKTAAADEDDLLDAPVALPIDAPPEKKPKAAAPVRAAKDEPKPVVVPAPVVPTRPKEPSRALLTVPVLGGGELDAAWETWRTAFAGGNAAAADKAFAELGRLKEDFAIDSLDTYAAAMARASDKRRESGDTSRALILAENAVALAPSLPVARWTLARALVAEDPAAVGQSIGEVASAIRFALVDPRFARPLFADLTALFLLAILATAAAVVIVLFARRVRYALHDFHHLFPRAAAKWQSLALAALLLSIPLVLRLGLVPMLLTLFATVALYLSRSERIVGATMLALVALVPLLTGPIASQTVFAGSPDEDLSLVVRGGPEAQLAAARIERRRKEEHARFEELFALAHLNQRRGRLAESIAIYKEAAILKSEDPRLSLNLGAALHASGDLAGAEGMYQAALAIDPELASAYFNLAVLLEQRTGELQGDPALAAAVKSEKARDAALAKAPLLASRIPRIKEGGPVNRVLLTVTHPPAPLSGLTATISAERVQAQLGSLVNGNPELIRLALLLGLIAGAAWLAPLGATLKASRPCERCGRSACRRCDPELGPAGILCAQCVNVFSKRGAVAPQLKLRKQAEVASHAWMQGRISSALGLVCSGAGHLFLGAPVRGVLFLFVFFFSLLGLGLRDGLVRVPYGATPLLWKLVPLALLLVVIYASAFASLRRQQARQG